MRKSYVHKAIHPVLLLILAPYRMDRFLSIVTLFLSKRCPEYCYMLFALNGNGVPSVSKILKVGP